MILKWLSLVQSALNSRYRFTKALFGCATCTAVSRVLCRLICAWFRCETLLRLSIHPHRPYLLAECFRKNSLSNHNSQQIQQRFKRKCCCKYRTNKILRSLYGPQIGTIFCDRITKVIKFPTIAFLWPLNVLKGRQRRMRWHSELP